MKKVVALILLLICFASLVSCDKKEPENQTRVQRGEPSLNLSEENTQPQYSEDVRLVVNGKDITEGNYVRIDRTARYAEIPIAVILEELGYDVLVEYDQDKDSYAVITDEFVFVDTQYEDFGIRIGNGVRNYVRSIIDGQIIVDSNSVFTQMYWMYNAEIEVDYTTNTVYIDSFDPYASIKHDARLVVNGKDITEGNCASFKEYHNGMEVEIPLLAVVKALGAKVKWQSETVVAVKYKGETRTYDTSKDDYGVFIPLGGVATRKIENGDLIFDLTSIERIIEGDYDVTVKVDEENYIIYVDSK